LLIILTVRTKTRAKIPSVNNHIIVYKPPEISIFIGVGVAAAAGAAAAAYAG
jgi:hypothetical protein